MAKAQGASYAGSETSERKGNHAKRMCNHVAAALLVYTVMLIGLTSRAMDGGSSIYPYFVLVLLVALVIPFLRNLERRWQALEKSDLGSAGLETRFNVDLAKLWSLAVGLPIILWLVLKAIP